MRETRDKGGTSSLRSFPTPRGRRRGGQISPPLWGALLERFYSAAGQPIPKIEVLDSCAVPQPYHRLLVHSKDMTPTLEEFYQQPLALQVLGRDMQGESYSREVLLRLSNNHRPVEYGVIRIMLDHFPPSGRRRILEEQSPLGAILRSESIVHLSWPQAFFRAEADPRLQTLLELEHQGELYGRRNVLVDGSRRLLAEVIEILPTVEHPVPTRCGPDERNPEVARPNGETWEARDEDT